jgi:hypothetical protein
VAGDEPGAPVRYAVQLHVLMSQVEMELWESLADRRRLEMDDACMVVSLSCEWVAILLCCAVLRYVVLSGEGVSEPPSAVPSAAIHGLPGDADAS